MLVMPEDGQAQVLGQFPVVGQQAANDGVIGAVTLVFQRGNRDAVVHDGVPDGLGIVLEALVQ